MNDRAANDPAVRLRKAIMEIIVHEQREWLHSLMRQAGFWTR
jgi:hypothetical protein